jgi:glutamate synthase (NADPH/NADH) large chain
VSKIAGAGFSELESDLRKVAALAWTEQTRPTREGIYRYMHGGEQHAFNPDVVMQLQQAVASGDWADYLKFTDLVNHRPVLAIRDLLALKPADVPIPLSRVEKEDHLFPRFDTAAMSIGALSPEAHESLAIAMNRLGGRSNSGEGPCSLSGLRWMYTAPTRPGAAADGPSAIVCTSAPPF